MKQNRAFNNGEYFLLCYPGHIIRKTADFFFRVIKMGSSSYVFTAVESFSQRNNDILCIRFIAKFYDVLGSGIKSGDTGTCFDIIVTEYVVSFFPQRRRRYISEIR